MRRRVRGLMRTMVPAGLRQRVKAASLSLQAILAYPRNRVRRLRRLRSGAPRVSSLGRESYRIFVSFIRRAYAGDVIDFPYCSWRPPGNAIWQPK